MNEIERDWKIVHYGWIVPCANANTNNLNYFRNWNSLFKLWRLKNRLSDLETFGKWLLNFVFELLFVFCWVCVHMWNADGFFEFIGQKETYLKTDKLSIAFQIVSREMHIHTKNATETKKLSNELVFTLNRIRHGAIHTLLWYQLILRQTERKRRQLMMHRMQQTKNERVET